MTKMSKTEETKKSTEKSTETKSGIVVRNPLDLRPVELPLVIELPEGASEAQKAYANILNAYAYKNPTKWAIKKDKLIAELEKRASWPDPLPQEGGIKYKNHRIG